ncbi:MAG: hypothetical protein PSY12_04955 [bacterium]|nr:hypothetical protein [bacterium]
MNAITNLAESASLRRAMGNAARQKSLTYFWDAESEKVMHVYRRLVDRSPSRQA